MIQVCFLLACVASEGRVVAGISVLYLFFVFFGIMSQYCTKSTVSCHNRRTDRPQARSSHIHIIQCLLFGVCWTQKLILLYTWIEVLGL